MSQLAAGVIRNLGAGYDVESLDYLSVAFTTVFTDFFEDLSQPLVVRIDKISEQFDFRVLYVGTDFDASYEFETIVMGKTLFNILGNRIVVCDSDRIEISLVSLPDTISDRTTSVRNSPRRFKRQRRPIR